MKIFDSHCHLDDRSYEKDRADVIQRAQKADVVGIMIVGVDIGSSRKAVGLAESHAGCYASVGVHPHDAKECSEDTLDKLQQLAQNPNVHAWGETGLDFNRMYSPQPDQEKWFIRQLEIARALDLPLIFHERDSDGRFLELLKAHTRPGMKNVIHCFSGSRAELEQYLEHGLYIGITGILTIKARGAELRNLVTRIPAERILIETDAPYLTPAPEKNRTRRNEPAFVRSVLMKLADVRGERPEELAQITWENTCRLYGIDS
jgi:TatD DNase family protein